MIRQMATLFSRWTIAASLLAMLIAGAVVVVPRAQADENRWGFGSDLGLTTGMVHGTAFTLAFNGDYYIDRNFSVGPMMQISPMSDLFQVSFAGVGRYHFRLNNGFNLVPFSGIGLVHVDLDRGTGPGRIDRNDTSWYIPIGLSLEYQATHNLALSSTLIVNLHDINFSPSLSENDRTSIALLFGFRFNP
jgi:Autotransporter beta-domain